MVPEIKSGLWNEKHTAHWATSLIPKTYFVLWVISQKTKPLWIKHHYYYHPHFQMNEMKHRDMMKGCSLHKLQNYKWGWMEERWEPIWFQSTTLHLRQTLVQGPWQALSSSLIQVLFSEALSNLYSRPPFCLFHAFLTNTITILQMPVLRSISLECLIFPFGRIPGSPFIVDMRH